MSKLVYGVGVSSEGKFARSYTNIDGKSKHTKEYTLWRDMLKRCYSEKYHKLRPTYLGCSVSEGFKNFQYFAEWCQAQTGFGLDNYQLDKDILTKGNKEYDEVSCVFVPRELNSFLIKCDAARGKYPIGVCYIVSMTSYLAQGYNRGKNKHLGYFSTPEEAFQAYKLFKEALAKELAIEYKGLVDPRVIQALLEYTVEEND